jgi:hypothetical protein
MQKRSEAKTYGIPLTGVTAMFKTIAAVLLLSLFAMPSHAATIEWDLNNVSVIGDPSITLQGYFVFDTVNNANGGTYPSPNGPSNFNITAYQNGVPLESWQPLPTESASFFGGPLTSAPPVFGFNVDSNDLLPGQFSAAELVLLSTSPFDTPLQHVALVAGDTNPYNESGMFGFSPNAQDLSGYLDGHVAATPLPPALPMFAAALAALSYFGWRRQRKDLA